MRPHVRISNRLATTVLIIQYLGAVAVLTALAALFFGQGTRNTFITISAAASFLALVYGSILGMRMSRSFDTLTHTAAQIADGNLDAPRLSIRRHT